MILSLGNSSGLERCGNVGIVEYKEQLIQKKLDLRAIFQNAIIDLLVNLFRIPYIYYTL